ncbi:MAG: FAD-dependent oxidoreductase, partial [Hyphomicrobiales bacterium]|nr:FAD-dependent oxidoreductase [Hyphomicrobiales bacterium]
MPNGKLTSLDGQRFDVVIIGAGINGASSAQHLAAAGYSVLLADKGDFGS